MASGIDKYDILSCIGKGNFGDVYKAKNRTNHNVVAIKVVNLDESTDDIKVLVQEIQFLSRLRSCYITTYFETFVCDYNMYIVMEYCGGQSCQELIKYFHKIPEEMACYIIRDVLKGLSYLHSEGKVHRDIKSANLLLTEAGDVKLADFGVSGEITLTQAKRNTFVGTPFWMAPEVILKAKRYGGKGYNQKADIWSAGITTIELLTGSPPLAQYDAMKVIFEIPKQRPPTLRGDFSENIKDFVKYCLVKDPKKRPSADRLLHHSFITSLNSCQNALVKTKLVEMILEKNQILGKQNKMSKRPRIRLRASEEEMEEEESHWDFNTFKSFHMRDVFEGHSGSEMSRLQANDMEQLEDEEPAMQHSTENELPEYQAEQERRMEPGQHLQQVSRGEILFYCLEQVYLRSRTEGTKQTVQKLINNVLEYERDQPGLAEAIVEEMLHFQQ